MPSASVFELQRLNLDGFLFADVGVEASGNPLSVLSALARMGLDPWQEGSRLVRLPRAEAATVMGCLIATLPGSQWPHPQADVVAARLVALLPKQVGAPPAPRARLSLPRGVRLSKQSVLLLGTIAALLVGVAVSLAFRLG